ncbi:MAG: amidase [Dehalococcoidia bacterium]|nr:amidase [Dehalococcoidia bacterium]
MTTRVGLDPFTPATEMIVALRKKLVSARELLDLHLARIERHNPALNAIITPDFDNARKAAERADQARTSGEDGPLLGLPLTIKDCIDCEGLPSTAGLAHRGEHRAECDSLLAARLKAAGAVLMGKTNIPPLASDWQSNNRLFGRSNNPWDLGRTPGGSTGGGAAALAAGLTPLEFGSDVGGSIRIPAAFCGLYGHRPSETVVPRSGHFPGSPLPNWGTAMSVMGPLARSAKDLELALDVIAGPEIGEEAAWRLELPPTRRERLSDFRVAVLPAVDWLPLDAGVAAALEGVVDRLGGMGASVGRAAPENLRDTRAHHRLYISLLTVMMFREVAGEAREELIAKLAAGRNEFDPVRVQAVRAGASEFLGWHAERERHRAAYRDFFRDWDVLLAPATMMPAFKHDAAPFNSRRMVVDGTEIAYDLHSFYPGLSTLAGQPATAFPVGLSAEGLPIGLQVIGPYLEDRTPIGFAALMAREIGGFSPPPGFAD